MNKITVGLIVFSFFTFSSSAIAWDVNVGIGVQDAEVDVTATATTDDYGLATSAGVDGTGSINVHGNGDEESGYMMTSVSGQGELYATQGMGVAGCLVECTTEPCDECPNYEYGASSYAVINGAGQIVLTEVVGLNTTRGIANGQILVVKGVGAFTAGMMSSLWIEGMDEPIDHAMGAYGQNVEFSAVGMHGMDVTDGANAGFFTTNMNFINQGCEGDECPESDPEPEPPQE